jgi:hypothetical protein
MGVNGKSWEYSGIASINRIAIRDRSPMVKTWQKHLSVEPKSNSVNAEHQHRSSNVPKSRCAGALGGHGKKRQTACKPGSVPAAGGGWPFLWDARYRAPRATDPDGRAETPLASRPAIPTWSCSRWGLPCRRRCRRRGALLPHHFTLTARRTGVGGVFLWHFPWGRPRRALPGTAFPWSPDFPLPAGAESGHPAVWRS